MLILPMLPILFEPEYGIGTKNIFFQFKNIKQKIYKNEDAKFTF